MPIDLRSVAGAATVECAHVHEPRAADEVVLRNARMQRLHADAARAARGRLPVLVLGETGVGKELVARAIHRASPRRDKPLVAVNCATFAASLLESTLFGHERGAFTGATQRSPGILERAHGGTLFLDEVGDLDTSAQVALLRAIEDQKITRLGATSEIVIDVHVIAATNCDLETLVEQGRFRGDLLFRLNGIRLDVPPLRERRDEIEPLARVFLERACREWQLEQRDLSPEAVEALQRCSWPGNVRQLRYAMERAALLAPGPLIMREDLPEHVTGSNPVPPASITCLQLDDELGLRRQLAHCERALIEAALRRAGGNRETAAKLLRVPLRTLFRKLRSIHPTDPTNS